MALTVEEIDPENLASVELYGEQFVFDKTRVPDPPASLFSDDIPRLFKEWHHSSALVVNGRAIPIKHWQLFYAKRKGIKQHAWDAIRVRLNNWKVGRLF